MGIAADLFERYRGGILYLIFGACTVVVSWLSYALFVWSGIDVSISNVLSWICAVSFAFVVNKWFVFLSRSTEKRVLVKEISSFFLLRMLTGFVRIAAFPILYYSFGLSDPLFGVNGFAAVIIITVIEVALNYFASKFIVFRQKKESAQ
ncbi:MAG: GtrA family protein [Candidatus Methanoplasma sp.]|jgi:putative flippase GtrA|nr:GtrA family protein [Candidatus Methanoplasma sp.]